MNVVNNKMSIPYLPYDVRSEIFKHLRKSHMQDRINELNEKLQLSPMTVVNPDQNGMYMKMVKGSLYYAYVPDEGNEHRIMHMKNSGLRGNRFFY